MAGKGDSLANSSEIELSSGLDNLVGKDLGKHNIKNGMDENVEFELAERNKPPKKEHSQNNTAVPCPNKATVRLTSNDHPPSWSAISRDPAKIFSCFIFARDSSVSELCLANFNFVISMGRSSDISSPIKGYGVN